MPDRPRIIHKALLGQSGEAGLYCFTPPRLADPDKERWILSQWLHDEITCDECRARLHVADEPSRGSLLRNNLEIRLAMVFQFVDANYWNRKVRRPDEEKINPDPDGWLAGEFLRLTKEFDDFMRPLIAMMEKHEDNFGWAEFLSDKEGGF